MALTLFRLQNACVGPSLGVVSILDHVVQCVRVKDTLNQGVNALGNLDAAFRHRHKDVVFFVGTVFVGDMIIVVYVGVPSKITINIPSLFVCNRDLITVKKQSLPGKVFRGRFVRTLVKILPNALLQPLHKFVVTLGSDNGQLIHLLHLCSERIDVHTVAILIDAKAQAAANFLAFFCRGTAPMLQGADLKHVRIVPSLTQRGVGEDEAYRIIKRKQAFLIFKNQVISGDMVADRKSVV